MDEGVVRGGEATVLVQGPFTVLLLERGDPATLLIHSLAPRALGSPVHTHRTEAELSYILEGEVGAEIGGRTQLARPEDLVVKPRGVPHAFWNAGDAPARMLEVITPGGFEEYFVELGTLLTAPGGPDFAALGALAERFGLEMDPTSIPRLAQEHGLQLGP